MLNRRLAPDACDVAPVLAPARPNGRRRVNGRRETFADAAISECGAGVNQMDGRSRNVRSWWRTSHRLTEHEVHQRLVITKTQTRTFKPLKLSRHWLKLIKCHENVTDQIVVAVPKLFMVPNCSVFILYSDESVEFRPIEQKSTAENVRNTQYVWRSKRFFYFDRNLNKNRPQIIRSKCLYYDVVYYAFYIAEV